MIKVSSRLFFVLFLFSPLVLPAETPPEYDKGLESLFQGEYADAEKILREAFEKNPALSPPGIVVALLYNEKGANRETREWLEKTTDDYPEDPEAYLLIAQIAFAEDRFTESKILAEYGLAKTEKYTASPARKKEMEFRALGILANLEEDNDRWENTIVKIERMLVLQPEHLELNARLAVLQFRTGKTEAAIAQMDKANALNKETPSGLIAAAEFFFREGKNEESEKYLAMALEKHPDDWHVFQIAAWLEIQKRDLKKAAELIEKAIKLSPDSPKTILTAGFIALYENDYLKAEKLFQQALFVSPENPQAIEGMALALCEQEGDKKNIKHERALFFAKSNEKNFPGSADAKCTLAWVSYKTGSDRREILNVLTYISQSGNLTPLGAYCLGCLHEELGDKDEAVAVLERSLTGKANFPKRRNAEKLLESLRKKEN